MMAAEKTTRYFREQVMRKRPYIEAGSCLSVLDAPLRQERQHDGRFRFWGRVHDPRDGRIRVLRVVTLSDGETIHNAFFDRGYREERP